MKKRIKKLELNRETLRRLDGELRLRDVRGGVPPDTELDCTEGCDDT